GGSWWPEVVGRAADHLGAAVSGAARFGRTAGSARPKRSLDDVVGFVDEILRNLGALDFAASGLTTSSRFELVSTGRSAGFWSSCRIFSAICPVCSPSFV